MNLLTNNPRSPYAEYLREVAPIYPECTDTAVYLPDPDAPSSAEGFADFIASLPEHVERVSLVVPYPQDHHTILLEQKGEVAARAAGKTLTILRLPEYVFGEGVEGQAQRLFSKVMTGEFVAVRGLEAHRCAVTAYDVARAILALSKTGGTLSLTDRREHTLTQIAEAMSSNAGRHKRTLYIPDKWAPLMARLGNHLPFIGKMLNSNILQDLQRDDLPDTLATPLPFEPYDAVEVLARRDPNFPYRDK